MQIIQTREGTVQDGYSHEMGQYKTDILMGWDSKGYMQIIQTWEGTFQDRYDADYTDKGPDSTRRIDTRRDSTRPIYSRHGTVRD